MRGDGTGGPRRTTHGRIALPLLLALLAVVPGIAAGEGFRGYAQVQYELQDRRAGAERDLEWWLRTVRLDYAARVRNRIDVTAQGEYNYLTYVGRSERRLDPRGSLRVAHPEFGGYFSYRPVRTTDALGVTARQQETMLTGYLSRPGLPQVQASYIRRRRLRQDLMPEQRGTQKSVTANHQIDALQLRGSWTRAVRETELAGTSRSIQTDWTGGAEWAFHRARTSGQFSYGGVFSRRGGETGATVRTSVHTVAAHGMHTMSRRTAVTATYNYRRTDLDNVSDRSLDDHQGAATLRYSPTPAVTASGGGGVRTAQFDGRREVERYLVASLAAQGRIRQNWTGAAGLTRSVNWLPGESSRLVDALSTSTRMLVRQGLELTAQSHVTAGRNPAAVADTSGRRVRVTAQTTVGLTAMPLRPVTVRYAWSEYRTGGGLFDPDATSRSDIWDARWNPVPSLQFSGTLTRSKGLGRDQGKQDTKQATAQWMPGPSLQVTGTYVTSGSDRLDPITQSLLGRKVFGLRVLAAPLNDWRVQASWNDIDPGRASHVRQWGLTLTRSFGR